MSEGKTNMFGKTYNTIGSAESNFIIKTKGDVKIQWGNKYIDLIKNGKVNSSSQNLINTVSSVDEITEDGIYYIEDGQLIYVCVNGNTVLLNGDSSSISYAEEQELTIDQINVAQHNLGLWYSSSEEAITAGVKYFFNTTDNKFYTITDGTATEYGSSTESETVDFGTLEIYSQEKDGYISIPNYLNFLVATYPVMQLTPNQVNIYKVLSLKEGLQSDDYSDSFGYRLTTENGDSVLDVDVVNIRKSLNYTDYTEVYYENLQELIASEELETGKKYLIKDYQNPWNLTEEPILDDGLNEEPNVRPIVVTAASTTTLRQDGYILALPECTIHYDVDYTEANSEGVTARGRITYLKDTNNNVANFDFKDKLFDENYLFSDDCTNNTVTLSDINYVDWPYIVLTGTANNNNITITANSKQVIGCTFNNNTITGDWFENTLTGEYSNNIFNGEVSNNTFIGLSGNTFNSTLSSNTQTGTIQNNIFKGSVTSNTFSSTITSCTFSAEVNQTEFKSNLNNSSFNYPILSTDVFSETDMTNCNIWSTLQNSIIVLDDVKSILSSEERSEVTVRTDTLQYLTVTSDSSINIPSGTIVMWAGTKDIPTGWVVCDGENGTPNLVGKFIKAVGSASDVGEKLNSDLDSDNNLTLQEKHLPAHSHPHKEHTHTVTQNSVAASESVAIMATLGEDVAQRNINSISTEETTLTTEAATSEEAEKEWSNEPIKIEPNAYALLFIMKI